MNARQRRVYRRSKERGIDLNSRPNEIFKLKERDIVILSGQRLEVDFLFGRHAAHVKAYFTTLESRSDIYIRRLGENPVYGDYIRHARLNDGTAAASLPVWRDAIKRKQYKIY